MDEQFSEQQLIEILIDETGYDIAQVCQNGHLINRNAGSDPEQNQSYCSECGARTLIKCEHCQMYIKGGDIREHFDYRPAYSVPQFCHHCGKPYLWTGARLKAAKELADELDALDSEEKELLKQSIDELVLDTPQTPVAATRYKRLMLKGGKELASTFKDILVDIASETAKKMIWPS